MSGWVREMRQTAGCVSEIHARDEYQLRRLMLPLAVSAHGKEAREMSGWVTWMGDNALSISDSVSCALSHVLSI